MNKKEIAKAYGDGKITEQQYDVLLEIEQAKKAKKTNQKKTNPRTIKKLKYEEFAMVLWLICTDNKTKKRTDIHHMIDELLGYDGGLMPRAKAKLNKNRKKRYVGYSFPEPKNHHLIEVAFINKKTGFITSTRYDLSKWLNKNKD